MPWVRLDDRFPTHRKVALLSDRAFRLYVSALCWSSENLTEGHISDRELTLVARVRGTKTAATELVTAQLWEREDDGYVIHDFLEYNPSRARVKEDRERNSARQQAFRDRKRAARDDVEQADDDESNAPRNGVTDPPRNAPSNAAPSPTRPLPPTTSYGSSDVVDAPERRDVEALCAHLADRIEQNGSKRPTITKAWRTAARLMLDKDGRTEQQVHTAIDWCQDSDFWRANVLSMPKLRSKYDQLRLQASRQTPTATGGNVVPIGAAQPGRVARAASLFAAALNDPQEQAQ